MIMTSDLSLPVARPPWSALGKKLESMTRKALYDYELIDDSENLAIALSGGKDSLTLLYLLHAISGRGFPALKLHAIHVRGEFSCGSGVSLSYLEAICKDLDVSFTVCESTQSLEKLECYSCSRERRQLLFDAAKKVGATSIAFGHHRDDSVQTLMMNLLHKGEFAGNLPKVKMEKYGMTIIRPLIYLSEDSIRAFSKQHGFARIVCRCPVGQTSLRRKTDDLLSQLEEHFPHARQNLAHAIHEYGSTKAAKP